VTEAGPSRREELRARERAYLVKMGIRTLCLLAAILVFALGAPKPVILAFSVGAIVLPYIAVVDANSAQGRRPARKLPGVDEPGRRALKPGRGD
jgi:Flp pilus assembly protein TadB